MSTITREWLKLKIADMEARRDDPWLGLDEDDSNTLAALRIALASLEAEAFACPKCNGTGMADSGGVQPWGEPINVPCDCTAPPAPVVPNELTRDEYKRRFMEEDNFDDTFIGGWNACRAAMLQGSDGNSPVIPDGLNIRAVAALREAVRNQWLKSDDFADRVYWKSMHDIANEIVSAMLAAAPQQEVKP